MRISMRWWSTIARLMNKKMNDTEHNIYNSMMYK